VVALLSNRRLLGATLGHFLQDIWLGIVPILMATASHEMGLTNAQVGLGYTLYQSLSGLTQPFFGHLTERYGSRWLGVGGVLWTSFMVGVAGFAHNYLLLVIATGLAGLGSGAFHPQGTGNAAAAGGQDRRATSAAVFFLGGTLGQALVGAALGGLIMTYLGMRGIALLSALVWVVALTVLRPALPSEAPRISGRSGHTKGRLSPMTVSWVSVTLLLGAMATRSMSRASFTGYVPKLWQDAGRSAAEYGFLLSLYLAGSALGGVTGSYVSRWRPGPHSVGGSGPGDDTWPCGSGFGTGDGFHFRGWQRRLMAGRRGCRSMGATEHAYGDNACASRKYCLHSCGSSIRQTKANRGLRFPVT